MITTKKTNHKTAAFTLMEVLIALGVSVFMVGGVTMVLIMTQRTMMEAWQINLINNETRSFADHIARDIRNSVGLDDLYVAGGTIYTITDGQLILRVPSINEWEDPIDVIGATNMVNLTTFDYIIYREVEIEDPPRRIIERLVYPNAASSRLESSREFGNIVEQNSFAGAFSIEPDALGVFVVRYQFIDTNKFKNKTYRMPISGSVRIRN